MSADSVAQDQIRAFFERWQRLEEEKTAISGDLKELFGEARAQGFDGKALRIAFRKALKANDVEAQELDTIVGLYVGAILGTVPAAHTHAAREAA